MNRAPKVELDVLGSTYPIWRKLQHGQENIVRFGRYVEKLNGTLRKQNGHEHRCSVEFLVMDAIVRMRPYISLDELLVTRAFDLHDIPEGILGVDVPGPLKTGNDDLREYLAFQELIKDLELEVQNEMERCYLLQFCLENPVVFPFRSRRIMYTLSATNRNEAMFFDGVQRMDYMYYAYECFVERDVALLIEEVTANQLDLLDQIACELPGFKEVIWTKSRRDFFQSFLK